MIRAPNRDDAQAVAGHINAINSLDQPLRHAMTPAIVLRDLLGDHPKAILRVAEHESRVAGFATFHTTYETEFAARGCYLGDLYVRTGFRRRGIGRALLAAAARAAREEGGSFLWWTALPRNEGGHAFYRAIGAEGEPLHAFALTFGAFQRLADEAP